MIRLTGELTSPEARSRPARSRASRIAPAVVFALACGLLAGCGIRATPVPVDAGAAPTRAGCVAPGAPSETEAEQSGATVRVYLVCGSRVAPVQRRLDVPPGGDSATDRLDTARKLLGSLQAVPEGEEAAAGFSTDVPRGLRIEGPRDGDPAEALRLGTPPSELKSFALAQLVCTFTATPVADDDDRVVLGGPPGTAGPLKKYACDSALRDRPDEAGTAGTPL